MNGEEQPQGFFPGIEQFSPEVQAALRLVQQELHLPAKLRCAMPEFTRAADCGWNHRPVTACIQGSLPGLSASTLKQTFIQALDGWNACANIGLQWTDDFNYANIKAKCGGIDGSSGTLAWSYLPQCGLTPANSPNLHLDQLYDTSEGWTTAWFLEVCSHELGHAVGLSHSNMQGALMYPYSSGGSVPGPTQYEIAKVVPVYGAPVTAEPAPGLPVISGGTLVMADGTVVGVTGVEFNYAGEKYLLEVYQ